MAYNKRKVYNDKSGKNGEGLDENSRRTERNSERSRKDSKRPGGKSDRFGKNNERRGGYGDRSVYNVERSERMDNIETEDMNEGLDKLEGRNSVLEAIRSDRTINKILVSKGDKEGSIKQIIALAREKGIIIQETDRASLDKISITHAHQGVIAFVAVKDYVEVEDILEIAKEKGEPPFIILLDGITDPHNLGSILRTANAVGAHGVVIPKRRAIGLTAAVSKASAGAIEYVPVARVTNMAQTIEYLKEQNIWVVGTDQSGEKSFYDIDLKGAIALVIGSEGEGMGKLVSEKCDFVVNLPMKGEISSLNAAVAGAIVMYEILKQRSK
jgi:23S rRNA (guanosine2251-2'-O)-methyltransferase